VKSLTPRTKTLIFAGIALLALILLASTLNGLTFSEGTRLEFPAIAPQVTDPGIPPGWGRTLITILRLLIIVGWLVLPFYIILVIVSKDERKRLLRTLAVFLPLMFVLYLLSTKKLTGSREQEASPFNFNLNDLQQGQSGAAAPMPVFQAPPAWVTTAVTIAIAVAIALLVLGVGYAIWRRTRKEEPEPIDIRIENQAQAALEALQSGADLRDVILRCYLQMVEALKEYRGIQRDRDMTPREFEDYLERRGLPQQPVRDLTGLFEQVRYGGLMPGLQAERQAVASLSAIVSACQKMRG
jgi:hypothetical protein